jgi:hypothetical protein
MTMNFENVRPVTAPSPAIQAESARLARAPFADVRTDLWVRALGAVRRFWLAPDQLERLEREFAWTDPDGMLRATGLFRVYGALVKGRYELEGRSVGFAAEGEASLTECRRIIVEALVGGKVAAIDGAFNPIDRAEAEALVAAHLEAAPALDTWGLAFAIMHNAIHGRPATEAERGKPATMPVIPSEVTDLASGQAAEDALL